MYPQNQGQQQGPQSQDCIQDAKKWWTGVPFFNKSLITICTLLYIIDGWFLGYLIAKYTVNSVEQTFFNLHIWSPFTTWLIHPRFLNLLFSLFMVYQDGILIEKRIGTSHFFAEMVFKNFLIQILFLTLTFTLGILISSQFYMLPSMGLFPTVMLFITLRSLANPEQERPFMCFPILVKNKYYHWIIFVLFSLFSGFPLLDLLCAILIAYIEVYKFNGQILAMDQQRESFLFNRESQDIENLRAQNIQQEPPRQESYLQGRGVQIGGSPPPYQGIVINPVRNEYQVQQQGQQNVISEAAKAALNRQENQNEISQEKSDEKQQDNDNYDYQDKTDKKKNYQSLNEENSTNLL